MRELLLKLSEKMPKGWVLKLPHESANNDYTLWQRPFEDMPPFTLWPNGGQPDIGLAPLTALLKQALGEFEIERIASPGSPFLWFFDGSIKCGPGFHTEFEAVAHAYLATKEEAPR